MPAKDGMAKELRCFHLGMLAVCILGLVYAKNGSNFRDYLKEFLSKKSQGHKGPDLQFERILDLKRFLDAEDCQPAELRCPDKFNMLVV